MKIRAYLRVSTSTQDVDNQRHGIDIYADKHSLRPLEYIEDTVSGSKDWRERKLGALIEEMERGDILVAAEISRMARSTLQILEILKVATTKGIVVHVVKEAFVLDGSMQAEVMATVFGLVATFERRMISARVTEMHARRKAQGLPAGRKPGTIQEVKKLDPKKAEILSYIEKGIPVTTIARLVNCSAKCLYNWMGANNIETPAARKKAAASKPTPAPAAIPGSSQRGRKAAEARETA